MKRTWHKIQWAVIASGSVLLGAACEQGVRDAALQGVYSVVTATVETFLGLVLPDPF